MVSAMRRDGLRQNVTIDGQLYVCDDCRPETPMAWMDDENWRRIEDALRNNIYQTIDRGTLVGYWKEEGYALAAERSDAGTGAGDPHRHEPLGGPQRLAILPAHAHVLRPTHPLGACPRCERRDDEEPAGEPEPDRDLRDMGHA
jgi:hypothetical protein